MDIGKPHQLLRRRRSERLHPSEKNRLILEDPTPLSESLEWKLAARYWHHHGVAPFSNGSVPYIINNSGWAPRAAAEVILAAGMRQEGRLTVIEVAAGSGIFARQVLDHIQTESERLGLDVYSRLTWVCTDGAAHTVQAWKTREQFLAHAAHVVMLQMSAEQLDEIALSPDTSPRPEAQSYGRPWAVT